MQNLLPHLPPGGLGEGFPQEIKKYISNRAGDKFFEVNRQVSIYALVN